MTLTLLAKPARVHSSGLSPSSAHESPSPKLVLCIFAPFQTPMTWCRQRAGHPDFDAPTNVADSVHQPRPSPRSLTASRATVLFPLAREIALSGIGKSPAAAQPRVPAHEDAGAVGNPGSTVRDSAPLRILACVLSVMPGGNTLEGNGLRAIAPGSTDPHT